MKYMGIDYGSKHTGIALSDDGGMFAFPHSIIATQPWEELIETIDTLAKREQVNHIVIGIPSNTTSPLSSTIRTLQHYLSAQGYEVVLEPEGFSSLHVDLFNKKKPIARKVAKTKETKRDDSAAALILSRYLSRIAPSL